MTIRTLNRFLVDWCILGRMKRSFLAVSFVELRGMVSFFANKLRVAVIYLTADYKRALRFTGGDTLLDPSMKARISSWDL
jgi:hypothetical protein